MIEDEDTKKPLTDDQIAKMLSKEGVKLSRRTVAKYRDQMQIPGSRETKNGYLIFDFAYIGLSRYATDKRIIDEI